VVVSQKHMQRRMHHKPPEIKIVPPENSPSSHVAKGTGMRLENAQVSKNAVQRVFARRVNRHEPECRHEVKRRSKRKYVVH
jgi:hypothetical protein